MERSEHGHFIVNHSINPRHDQTGVQCDGEVSRMGKKYIAELPDCYILNRLHENKFLQVPIVLENGDDAVIRTVIPLTPYTEPDMEQVRKEAYQQGAEDMRKALRLLIDCDEDCLTIPDIFKTFREGSYHAVVRKHPAMEIIEKIRQYEQKQEEIQVGDEIETPSGLKGYVVNFTDDELVHYVSSEGRFGTMGMSAVSKTGRHFPEIATVLAKMKES